MGIEKGANPMNKKSLSKALRQQKLRKQEEEENYKRYSITKKQKIREEKAMTRNEYESITTFGDVSDYQGSRYKKFEDSQKKGKKKHQSKKSSRKIFWKKKKKKKKKK